MTETPVTLIWRMACHAIIGVSLSITTGATPEDQIPDVVVRLLCMAGIGVESARELTDRPRPALGPETDD